ncbi:MAG: RNA polymerase sigma factor SigM [Marmoricola sp.]
MSDSGPRIGRLEELDDVGLLRVHADGDPDAFGVLFTRHRDRLWAVALRTTGNPEDAADALQEAMISAFRRAADFRAEAQVTTWLHRIVVNASLDRLRRNKVRAASALPDDLEDYAGRGALLTSTGEVHDPATEAVRSDQRAQVLAALDRLPPDQKAALVLVDMEGYPVEEASRILGCPTGTVKSRCARGRHRLLTLLEETGITRGNPPRPRAPQGTSPLAGASDSGTATPGGAR